MPRTPWPEAAAAFRDAYPIAWSFHANTSRWPFNTLEPREVGWAGPFFKEYPAAAAIQLLEPVELPLSLGQAIARRLSCRDFTTAPVSLPQLGTLLHYAYGVHGTVRLGTGEHLERPVPSGGGLYPLEIYVIARRIESVE